jgi:hypothetical protein
MRLDDTAVPSWCNQHDHTLANGDHHCHHGMMIMMTADQLPRSIVNAQ